jgi:hypothetical protein
LLTQTVAQNQQKRNCGAAARAYAERFRWAVLPLQAITRDGYCTCGREDCTSPGKHPLTVRGVKDATKDIGVIAGWWKRWPWANVGVATGAVSGFWALDIDGSQGAESLHDLEREQGRLPASIEQLTGAGGRHVLFKQPDFTVVNKVRLSAGLDVRGCGGYIVVAPSIHISGRQYQWELSSRPGEVGIAAAPRWLLDLLRPAETAGQAKTASEWQRVACTDAPEGERNSRLLKIAGHLLRHYVSPFLAQELLLSWNARRCRPPLPDGEVLKIIDSIAARELKRIGGGRDVG